MPTTQDGWSVDSIISKTSLQMEEVSTVERYKHTHIHTHYIHTYTNTNLDFKHYNNRTILM